MHSLVARLVGGAGIIAGFICLLAYMAPVAAAQLPPLPQAPEVIADLDQDGVFDNLEDTLERRSADDRVNVIVTLRSSASSERVRSLERSVGNLSVARRYRIVNAFAARVSKRRIEALARNRQVLSVEKDSRATAANDEAQAAFGVSEARLDVPTLDGDNDGDPSTYSPADLVAAVIDTGIDADHLDLDEGKVIGFQDFVNGLPNAYDDDGHGSHVSGTIAGEGDARPDLLYHGVAPAAALVGVKVLAAGGGGDLSDIVAGVDWVVANKALYGIEVINMSLRIPGCSNGTDTLSTAVNNAEAAGLVVIVAAGNEGPGTCKIGAPSAATGAITVGAMADFGSNGYLQAIFSSRGPTLDGRIKPDISAPGVDITSVEGGSIESHGTTSGTSQAAPFVSGVALLMLDANAALTPANIRTKITTTAIDWARGGNNQTVGTTGQDIDYGYGRLDAYAAIQSAGAALTSPPVGPAHEFHEGTLPNTPGAQTDYVLDINDTTFPIAATMIMPSITGNTSSNPDFDLFLFDPGGNEVASSEFSTRQEAIGWKPLVTGNYTLRVARFSGSGGYFVDVSRPQAPPPYARPGSATPLRIPLVPAYSECTTPTSLHVPPLALPSCTPVQRESSILTMSNTGRGSGFVRLDALPGDTTTAANEADMHIQAFASDVRAVSDGTDYEGPVVLETLMRVTDRANGYFGNEVATSANGAFSVPVECVATPATNVGATCSIATSANTLLPGFARDGKRAVISTLSFELLDPGPDETIEPGSGVCPPTCGSGDEDAFLHEGVFTP